MRFRFSKSLKVLAFLVGSVFAFGVFAASGGSSKESGESAKDELRIGLISAQSGPVAAFGIPEHDALLYMAEQANKRGGIDGHKVVVFSEDGKANPTEITKAARKLMLQHKVDVIVGATTGSGALAIGPLAARHKVPVIAPVGTISVTAKDSGFYDWMFRSSPNNEKQLDITFKHMKDKGYKRIGLFYQQDAYGENGAEYLGSLAEKAPDMKIVAEASAPLSAASLLIQATKIAGANPDVIMLQVSSPAAGAAFMRAIRQVGSNAPVIVAPGLATQAFIEAAGKAAEGVIATSGVGWDKPNPAQAEFIEGYGQPKNFGEALTGTAFLAVEAAVKNIEGEITGPKLRDALEHTCSFPTLFKGKGCFTPDNHSGNYEGAIVQVTDGKWVTIGTAEKYTSN